MDANLSTGRQILGMAVLCAGLAMFVFGMEALLLGLLATELVGMPRNTSIGRTLVVSTVGGVILLLAAKVLQRFTFHHILMIFSLSVLTAGLVALVAMSVHGHEDIPNHTPIILLLLLLFSWLDLLVRRRKEVRKANQRWIDPTKC